MGSPPDAQTEQARVLRVLASQLEQGAARLPPDLVEALVREIEDRDDLEASTARADEPSTPWEQVKAELGL